MLKIALLSITSLVVAGACFGAPVLTGAVNFSTDSTGTGAEDQVWNTLGGEFFYNLYVTEPNSGLAGPFINSGNGGSTGINVDLASPGTYTFYLFGQPGLPIPFFGLNLFFDGDNTNPGITVYRQSNGAGALATTSNSTFALNGDPVAGANTLTYNGVSQVTLTDYVWYTPGSTQVPAVDRVSAYDSIPDGVNDFRGYFVLQVGEEVPEPGSWTLLIAGLAGILLARRR